MKKSTLFLVTLFVTFLAISCQNRPTTLNEVTAADTMAVAIDTVVEKPIENTWEYSENIDKMTSKKTKFAIIKSNESIKLDFPYDGDNFGYLAVRKKSGVDIYIQVDKGQISGGYDNNYFTARFDDDKAIRFAYNEPQDNSSDFIFVDNQSKFLAKLKKSKKVLISLPFYQNGNQILEFNTANLKWE